MWCTTGRLKRFVKLLTSFLKDWLLDLVTMLLVTDMFWFAMDAAGDPKSNEFRVIVQGIVKRNHRGIIGIPGKNLLDPENQTLDLVHPSQAGMEQIAQRLYSAITVHL